MNVVNEHVQTGAEQLIHWLRDFALHRLGTDEINTRGGIPPHLLLEFGNKGLFGLQIPRAYQGTPLSMTNTMRIIEQVAAIDVGVAALLVVHHTSTFPLLHHGSNSIRERFLPLLASGRMLGSFALTEPSAGSNPRAMQTTARSLPGGRWRLDGTKSYIGGAASAGLLTVFARHPSGQSQSGISAFAVPRETSGLKIGPPIDLLGVRAAVLRDVFLENTVVEGEHVLGKLGQGLNVANAGLGFGRLSAVAMSLGAMKRCSQLMVRYASRRRISTGLLLDNAVTLLSLTDLTSAISVLESLSGRLAGAMDNGFDVPSTALLAAKVAGSELAFEATDRLIQLLGARGYVEANVAPRLLRDVRFLRIGEGPTEALVMQLGASLVARDQEFLSLLERMGGESSLSRLVEALDELSAGMPSVSIEEQLAWTQAQYYALGWLGIWSLLEAVTPADNVQGRDWLALRWNAAFQQAKATLGRHEPRWSQGHEVQTIVDTYTDSIGELDETVAVPQHTLDPFLRAEHDDSHADVVDSPGQTEQETTPQPTPIFIDLPIDRPFRSDGALHSLPPVSLEVTTADAISHLAEELGLFSADIIVAAYSVFLSRFSRQTRLTFFLSEKAGVSAIEVDLSERPVFLDTIKRLAERTAPTASNAAQVVAEMGPATQAKRIVAGGVTAGIAVGRFEQPTIEQVESLDLVLEVHQHEKSVSLGWRFDGVVFEDSTIQQRSSNFIALLEAIVDDPNVPVHQLNLLSREEYSLVTQSWQRQVPDVWKTTFNDLFARSVKKGPHNIAVHAGGCSLSYTELDERSNQVAQALGGQAQGQVVALFCGRTTDFIAGIVGVLKAGGAFLTLNPSHPSDRLEYMLEAANVAVLLTDNQHASNLPQTETNCINLDKVGGASGRLEGFDPTPNDLAYINFTSGSTGRPKGAQVSHSAICNQLLWRAEEFGLNETDRVLQSAAQNFDIAVWEYLGPLVAGASIVMMPSARVWDPGQIVDVIARQKVTTIQIVPSQLQTLLQTSLKQCDSLRRVFSGGEMLPRTLQESFFEAMDAELINLYGPTEAAIDTTFWRCEREDNASSAPIGTVVWNKRTYVLDEHQQPLPIGVAGELCIGGVGLAEGYLGRPELTAKQFLPDPFAPEGGRMYRSGDLVRANAEGVLQFLGRVDRQIKIRGVRIEPGEIQAALCSDPRVERAVVTARERRPGDRHLVGFVVLVEGTALEQDSLKSHAQTLLPREVVPSLFVAIDSLPITSTGKVDVRALPPVDWSVMASGGTSSNKPATELERTILSIWTETLGTEVSATNVDFFEAGGHSLSAVQVLTRVRETLGSDIRLSDFFAAPTATGLAQLVERSSGNELSDEAPVPTSREGSLPLAGTQENLWVLHRMDPLSVAYNVPDASRLRGSLDVRALERALNAFVQRHEAMRTIFRQRPDGNAEQVVLDEVLVPLDCVNLSPGPEQEERLNDLILETATASFDLSSEVAFRARLIEVGPEEHVLVWVFHHIIADGWSSGSIFVRELSELYCAEVEGRSANLSPLSYQPVDYVRWQTRRFTPALLQPQVDFWKESLSGYEPCDCFPTDYPRPPAANTNGARVFIELDEERTQRIKELARLSGTTPFSVLLAAFATLSRLYSGEDDFTVGTAVAGRQHASAEHLVGNFANAVVLRLSVDPSSTLRHAIKATHPIVVDAMQNGDVSFERVVSAVQPERTVGRNPLFDVVFTLFNGTIESLDLPGVAAESLSVDPGAAKFDLTLAMFEESDRLRGFWEYRTDLYEETTITQLAQHFEKVLVAMVDNPGLRVEQLSLLSDSERQRLLVEVNDVSVPYPADVGVHACFERWALERPEASAVVCNGQTLTYRELDRRANQLAHYLETVGCGAETLVGMCVTSSVEMIVGLLGVLKVGAAYVPLDPNVPAERLGFIADEIESPIILANGDLYTLPALEGRDVLRLDADWQRLIADQPGTSLKRVVSGSCLVNVIYTSGSTGTPKGVNVQHRGVSRLVMNTNYCDMSHEDVWSMSSNFAFDASTIEIWASLCNGASMVIAPSGVLLEPARLESFIEEHSITNMFLTTALFHLVASERPSAVHSLRSLLVGGEALDGELARRVIQGSPESFSLVNVYGPTECTALSTFHPVSTESDGRPIPIGRPIANTTTYVLDSRRRPLPVGITGELWIGGPGVARGYLNRPERTAHHFVTDPFSKDPGATMYATGDLVRWRADGTIEFMGRRDHQVKIRGFRIELGEIERCLHDSSLVRSAHVLAKDTAGTKRLVAYVVPASPEVADTQAIRKFLAAKLPDYMVPSDIVTLEELPLTPNGKIDRRKLLNIEVRVTEELLQDTRDPLELSVLQIWTEVLGVAPPSLTANFFEAGGDSLAAIRMLRRIEAECGVSMSPSVLYTEGSVAGLAEQIRAGRPSNGEGQVLVPLREKGEGSPLFIVHPISGSAMCFTDLARVLERPLYGLQSLSLETSAPPLESVEEMAIEYVKAIRTVQPEGPYLLAGWSFGGMVAYEMARQLEAEGERIQALLLLDGTAPGHKLSTLDTETIIALALEEMSARFGIELSELSPEENLSPSEHFMATLEEARRRGAISESAETVALERLVSVCQTNAAALARYNPTRQLMGDAVLIRAAEDIDPFAERQDLGWGEHFSGQLELNVTPGKHMTMMFGANVPPLSRRLSAYLNRSAL